MLDVKKLEEQFDQILASFTDADLQDWLDFAEKRELCTNSQNTTHSRTLEDLPTTLTT